MVPGIRKQAVGNLAMVKRNGHVANSSGAVTSPASEVGANRALAPAFGAALGMFRRDRRKQFGVDGEYASTGGVYISDEWLVTDPETSLP